MASIPLPALAIKEPPSPLETYSKIIGLESMKLQQQGEQQQQQIQGSQLKDIDAGRAMLAEMASVPSGTQITPEYIQKLGGKYGASLNAVNALQNGMLAVQQHVSEIAKNDAATKASNLETVTKQHDAARGQLMSIINGPQADKQTNWAKEIASAEQSGTIPRGQFSNVYPGDEAAQALADHMALGSVLAKETTEKMSATGSYLRGATAANDFAAKQNPQSPLYSPTPAAVSLGAQQGNSTMQSIQSGQAAQAGNVAGAEAKAKLPYEVEARRQGAIAQVQAQASQYAGNSALAKVQPHLVPAAVADATKVAQEYADAAAAADDMKTFIDLARAGNKIAYAYSPTEGVLTLNTARGVKRVNMPEIASYGGAGSAFDNVMGFLGKKATGASIPADVLNDMESLHGAIASNAQTKYQNKLAVINQNYGSNFTPVQMQSAGGQIQVKDPQGGVHTFADQASADRFKKLAGIP
jgi:hypothetical protein